MTTNGTQAARVPDLGMLFLRIELMMEPGEIWELSPSRRRLAVTSFGNLIRLKNWQSACRIPQHQHRSGYLRAHSGVGSANTHRLVAEAHLGPIPPGLYVLHYDGNPTNNRADNLRFGTAKDNYDDAVRHGTMRRTLYEHHVREILLSRANPAKLARLYGTRSGTIRRIRTGRLYAWACPELPRRKPRVTSSQSAKNT